MDLQKTAYNLCFKILIWTKSKDEIKASSKPLFYEYLWNRQHWWKDLISADSGKGWTFGTSAQKHECNN